MGICRWSRTWARCASFPGCRTLPWSSAMCIRKRESRSRKRRAGCCGVRSSAPPRQEEINLRYAEALEMADRHTLYKHGAKEIAHMQGCSLTFMAKYDVGAAGSSCHLHSSLWDSAGKRPLFEGKNRRTGIALFQHWLAGQLALAHELT